ncbi:MAG: hypothetical protein NTX03_10060 [Bacteroidetes bacterium]|nr:hypothetical protein [Bacteroidota bacterium]
MATKIRLSVEGLKGKAGSINIPVEFSTFLSVKEIGTKDTTKLLKDCEILVAKLKKTPEVFTELIKHFNKYEWEKAVDVLKKNKLMEEDFEKGKGGVVGLAILLFVVVMLYSCPAKGSDKKKDK